ncbi:gp53-like domain-containing protein [Megasphaera stantonii]|uniref:gp53-like domain-containing protein n=1 Tax=Megasphaera stantonii TaxID=2144175 RepID=UPI003B9687CA
MANVAVATRFSYGAFPHCSVQWGSRIVTSASIGIDFPVTFNTVLAMVATHSTNDLSDYKALALYNITNASFQVVTETYQIGIRYVSIGR